MPGIYVVVDSSNTLIEGQKQHAYTNLGIPYDPRLRISARNTVKFVADRHRHITSVQWVGSSIYSNPKFDKAIKDALHAHNRDASYTCVGRDAKQKECNVTDLVKSSIQSLLVSKEAGVLVLFSGRSCFRADVRLAVAKGWKVDVCAWKSSCAAAFYRMTNVTVQHLNDANPSIMYKELMSFKPQTQLSFPLTSMSKAKMTLATFTGLEQALQWPFTWHWDTKSETCVISMCYFYAKSAILNAPPLPSLEAIGKFQQQLTVVSKAPYW